MKIITHEVDGVWVRFAGTPQLDAFKVARLVEDGTWNGNDLWRFKLRAADPFVMPDGKVTVGPERFENEGRQQVFDVEDAPPAPAPQAIYPLQARKALRAAGLFDQVQAYVTTLPEDEQDEWEYALEIRRDHPVIVNGAAALGLTETQVDDLFRLGKTL